MYKTLPPGEKGEWNSTWLSTYSFFFSNFFFFPGCSGSLLLWRLFSSCSKQRLLSSCGASHCSDLSCCRAWALGHAGFSSCSSWALQHWLHSCGTQAQLLRGIWDLPGSGIKPASPALAGGFLTTKPPRKPLYPFLNRTVPRTAVSLFISLPGNIRGGQRNGSFVWQLAPLAVNILKVWTWGLWIDGVEQIKIIFNQACLGFTGNIAL